MLHELMSKVYETSLDVSKIPQSQYVQTWTQHLPLLSSQFDPFPRTRDHRVRNLSHLSISLLLPMSVHR